MPIVEYPFMRFSADSQWQPLLPLEIISPHNGHGIEGLGVVDTGATLCAIPSEWAEELGVSLDPATAMDLTSAGQKREAYKHVLGVRIFPISKVTDGVYIEEKPIIELPEARIALISDLNYVILGVESFLDKYVLTINYQRQEFSIRTPSLQRSCRICWPADIRDGR